jgi:hypothetical protein
VGALVSAVVGGLAVGPAVGAVGPRVSHRLYSTPKLAALSWFAAIDSKDRRATISHFVHAANFGWPQDNPANWATFTHVNCRQMLRRKFNAVVKCTFHESAAPDVGNPDTFWSVDLSRRRGRWLITDYGQP